MNIVSKGAFPTFVTAVILAGCSNTPTKRETALQANHATLDSDLARIHSEFESRRQAATTPEEVDAAFAWHREQTTNAFRRYNEEGHRALFQDR
jgi:outer membrane murein-binding lipoprotein Lpp